MGGRVTTTLSCAAIVLFALLVPPVLAANGIRAIASDWFVRFEYGHLPPDAYGLSRAERTELGLVGLRSILPRNEEGIGLLRRARLPDGGRAFREKELRHMADVRRLIGFIYPAHLAAVGVLVAFALVLAFGARGRSILRRGLAYGAALTLVVAALVALAVAVDAERFLTGFHRLFFEGRSWRFRDDDTLRRLYPDRFWTETATILGVAAALQAGVLLGVGRLVGRRRRQAAGARRRTFMRAPAKP